MKTPIAARITALAVSTFITFGTVHLIANYALPESSPVALALAAPRG